MSDTHVPGESRHYLTLDALRGVAALAVLFFHRRWWLPGGGWFGQGALAVDFFFMLSGFVVAAAYEGRIREGMSFGSFARVRVIRLYPMIWLGALLGAAYLTATAIFWFDGEGLLEVALQLPFALAALPAPPLTPLIDDPFHLNSPTWSLFYELTANVAFIALVPLLTFRRLWSLVGVSAALVLLFALVEGKYRTGNTYDSLIEGFARVSLPFFGGVLLFWLHRQGRLPVLRIHPLVLSVVLFAYLLTPRFSLAADVAYYCAGVFFLFPLLIAAGVSQEPQGWVARASKWGGAISYPLYATHIPMLFWFTFVAGKLGWKEPDTSVPYFLLASATCVVAAQAALTFYDEPVRRRLTQLWRPRRSAVVPAE